MAQLIQSGYLYKTPPKDKFKNKFADKWRLRWFKLLDNKKFTYYEDCNSAKPKGEIPLDEVEIDDIRHTLNIEKRDWVISINVASQNREYFLGANNKESMMSWFQSLKQVLKVDYILATEVASTNILSHDNITSYSDSLKRVETTGSARYIELLGSKLERIETEESTTIGPVDETNELERELIPKRDSKVSPYAMYDLDTPDNNDLVDQDNQVEGNEDFYMPMNLVNSIPVDEMEDNSDMLKNPAVLTKDPNMSYNRSNYNENYTQRHEQEQTYDENEIPQNQASPQRPDYFDFEISEQRENKELNFEREEVQNKTSYGSDIYETMSSPQADEPEIINTYDHLEDAHEHVKAIMLKLETEKLENREAKRAISKVYDDVIPYKIKPGSTSDVTSSIPVRVMRSFTEIETEDVFEPPILPPKASGLATLDELRKSIYGNFTNLLERYWIMYIFLPNKYVTKELVSIEAPVENLLKKLAKLFLRQKDLHDFNLYLVSDVHQTYECNKKIEKEFVKNDRTHRRLNNEMSFSKQGINSSKLLQLISIKEIDKRVFSDYLREKTEMSVTRRFCETWIPFVRGYFSIPDLREVASLGGYIHYIYQTTFQSKNISHDIFLPRYVRDIPECVKKCRDQSIALKDTPIETVCINFMKRMAVWPTANTLAFPIKRIGKGVLLSKQSDFLIVFANDHIGVVKADKNMDYSNFVYWWHKLDIAGFNVNMQKDVLTIKLTKPIDEGSNEFLIKSPMNKILCQLLENFFTEKTQTLTKRVSLGAMSGNVIGKELPETPNEMNM
ncbi:RB2-associated-binding protein-like protein [Oopsacas minuta]|uniref:RB2-associated-binding protein-like protein n=1 Tax=Oopsacas minuta TaxID=111878 RepID=A0AAV7K657_9METZ|nr:RB2-associated-binding protein-like protein [Oopsacas minuta]